jgi:hypothetical protein
MRRYGQDPTGFGVQRKLEARARRRRHSIRDGGAEKPGGKSVKAFNNSPSTLAEFRHCLQRLDTQLKRMGMDTFESHVFEHWGVRIPVEAIQPLKDLLQIKNLYPTASRTAEAAMAAERLGVPAVITDFSSEWERLKRVVSESMEYILVSVCTIRESGAGRRPDR